MKKFILLGIGLMLICLQGAQGQSKSWEGFSYQAVLQEASGALMVNRPVELRFQLFKASDAANPFYVETQALRTDAQGAIQALIGQGKVVLGDWTNIPWSQTPVWLRVDLKEATPAAAIPYRQVVERQLLAVPMAQFAQTAGQINENLVTAKNQSINWLTGGNTGTRPDIHFIGTRDQKNLVLRTGGQTHVTINTNGRIDQKSKVPAGTGSKPDADRNNYPYVVDGLTSNQGMWIQLAVFESQVFNSETFTIENLRGPHNYMTFADNEGVKGRIEGETLTELERTELYQVRAETFALQAVSITIEIVANAADATAKVTSGWHSVAGAAIITKYVSLGFKAASALINYTQWVERVRRNVGVAYKSNGADYAEWLLRKPGERKLHIGEVVGVKNGMVTLDTRQADHLLVVSAAPIALGNVPAEADRERYEKIAFMGQVPVRVCGPVQVNDYIIPSGNQDGLAIAVHPADMKALDYGRIIGIAWEAAPSAPLNIVNVAVGINTNDLAPRVAALAAKVAQLEQHLYAQHLSKQYSSAQALMQQMNPLEAQQHTLVPKMNSAGFDQFLDQNADLIQATYAQLAVKLTDSGLNIADYPFLRELFADPVGTTKKMRKNSRYPTLWAFLDQQQSR